MVVGSVVFVFVSVYAPQANLSESVKDQFYYALQSTIARVSSSEQLIISGDWNGHIGSHSTAFEDVHGGQDLEKRNHEGERLLEFAVANELVVGNFWFKKKFEHLVTYQSGDCKTQIDYLLYKRSFGKMVSNVKVIVGEECATQHRLVVGDFKACTHAHPKRRFVPRTKVWKLKDFGNQVEFSNVFNASIQGNETRKTLDERWKYLKNNLINATKQVCGKHYMHFLNVEFSWNPGGLSEVYPVEGPSESITTAMFRKAINEMSLGKAAGPSGIVAEMLKAADSSGASMIRDLIEDIIFENRIQSEWQESHIVSVYKGKGDALNRSNYRGLKLIDQVMKVLERVVEGFIRQSGD